MKYEVKFYIEPTTVCVEADNEDEAIELARQTEIGEIGHEVASVEEGN